MSRSDAENRELFDLWAQTYDRSVAASTEFPLAGYEQALRETVALAEIRPGMSVLDLGAGTGNLASLFLARGCAVWATDISPAMITHARIKCPGVPLSIADIRDGPPPSFPERYDRIVSAYAFHHLTLEGKVGLIRDLALRHLLPAGSLLVADVAFHTAQEREAAAARFADRWDPEEHYWAADETLEALGKHPLAVRYVQVSFCGGIFVIRPAQEKGRSDQSRYEANR